VRVVDALGTWCPVPIHLVARAARGAAPGDVIELLADDPMIEVDLPAWCHSTGHELTALEREGDSWVGRVTVRAGGRGPGDRRERRR
jgi:TusA-related sulfurtransferase